MLPSHWREALLAGNILPWLPELDRNEIGLKDQKCPQDGEWDWELLVRQLAQIRIRTARGDLQGLARGLRNQRRIWQLVENILGTKVSRWDRN